MSCAELSAKTSIVDMKMKRNLVGMCDNNCIDFTIIIYNNRAKNIILLKSIIYEVDPSLNYVRNRNMNVRNRTLVVLMDVVFRGII